MRSLWSLICLFILAIASAAAEETGPRLIATHGAWSAYHMADATDGDTCFIASMPATSHGNYKKRDPAFVMITHRPAEGTRNVISHTAGYSYDEKRAVLARTGRTEFLMVPKGDMAWTPNQKTDDALTAAIRKGRTLVITGFSARGTMTTDTYDLSGSGKALAAIDKACPVQTTPKEDKDLTP